VRVKVVTLCYAPSLQGFDDRPLSEFVRDKEVLQVREHFFCVHDLPHLACLVTYQDPAPLKQAAPPQDPRQRPDPAAELADEDRVLFGTLREWRSARSRKEGVPPYVLFTNRELVSIVRARPQTIAALQALDGIGAGKVERYGQALLDLVNGRKP
jgi:superfamily II DNA helicase RecQ